jgi:hypothetical protein
MPRSYRETRPACDTLLSMVAFDVVLALALVAALALVGARLGDALLARMGLPRSPERTVTGAALGLGILSHAIFALGLAGALGRWIAIALILAAIPLVRRLKLPRVAWPIALLAVPLVLLAIQPPTAWDAVSYRLPLAGSYAHTGHVAPLLHVRYPVLPQLQEMLFAVGLALAGPIAPALTELMLAALTGCALWAWGRRWFSPRAGLAAAALWLASPMIVFLATAAYVDVGLTLYATLAVLCAGNALVDDDDRWLIVAGALAGFAASCKYLGLPFGAGIGVTALLCRRWRGALAFGVVALLTGAPWYIYDFVHTGNPVFPVAGALFGFQGPWTAQDLAAQLDEMRLHGMGRSLRALALLPLDLTTAQRRFQVEAPFLPVFLPALAIAVAGAWRDRKVRALVAAVVAYGLFWFSTVQLLRYLVPASALLSLAVAGAAREPLERIGPRLRTLALLVLLAAPLGYAGWRIARDGVPLTPAARRAYLERALPGYDAIELLNRKHGTHWRAYQLYLERTQFFAEGTLYGDFFGPWRYSDVAPLLTDPVALTAQLRKYGVDYLIVPNEYGVAIKADFATPTVTVYPVPR